MPTGKYFRCDCGWAFHGLYIEPEDDGPFPMTAIQVVNAPADLSFWQRVKMAAAVLRGNEHVLSEIYIHRDEMREFVEYVASLAHNKRTGRQ
jgi:hypothetical protein